MNSDEIEILLVEDDPSDVELTLHALRDSCVVNRIHVVSDGEEALDFVFCRGAYCDKHWSRPPKVILLDLKLPKIDGHEVLKIIKNDVRTRAIPVVMMTSSREDRDLIASYHLGVNSYIQKPVDIDQFRQAVKQLGLYWLLVNEPPPAKTCRIDLIGQDPLLR